MMSYVVHYPIVYEFIMTSNVTPTLVLLAVIAIAK